MIEHEMPERGLETQAATPPINWYVALKNKHGIFAVTTSDLFRDIGGNVDKSLDLWLNRQIRLQNPKRSLEEKQIARQEAAQFSQEIQAETGFTPQAIWKNGLDLLEKYKGQQSAPFQIVEAFPPAKK